MAQQPGVIEFGQKLAREIGDFIFTNSQENLVTMKAVDQSDLLLSGTIKDKNGETIITYDAPHAQAVNDGTDPHFVKPEVLEDWVRRKINPGSEKKVKQIAFFVSRNIKRHGTKPRPFMTKAIALAEAKYDIKAEPV